MACGLGWSATSRVRFRPRIATSRATAGRPGRKYFFFEKKKQKTLALLVDATVPYRMGKKFFGSFFQKRTASLARVYSRRAMRSRRAGRLRIILVDKIIRKSPACSRKGQQGSSSFLKKRTKKLLLSLVRADRACRVNQQDKSFLVLFFKKELLPCAHFLSRLNTSLRSANRIARAPSVGFYPLELDRFNLKRSCSEPPIGSI